ncbi:DoxX family protein [Streptomyces sp. NPDC096311]|uniref:DoxX family protein n=1 Tax=Streptomyces sp. NPDC096311 TaxID=3366083 RepID=UPI003818D01F
MNVFLWILASLLAALFLLTGVMKLSRTGEQLAESGMKWAPEFPPALVKAIGALEVLAALGLILPAAFDIAETLVPLAAVGLVLLMVGAAVTHGRRKENPMMNVVLLVLAAVLAWGRFGPYSF